LRRRYWQAPLWQFPPPPGQVATHVPVEPEQHPELQSWPGTAQAVVHWKPGPQLLKAGQSFVPAQPQTPAGPQMLPPAALAQSLWPVQPQVPRALHFGPFGDVEQSTHADPQLCGLVFPTHLLLLQQNPAPHVPSPPAPQSLVHVPEMQVGVCPVHG
jgi:hypothetical protein